MPTVETARHSVRVRGTGSLTSTLRHTSSVESPMPQRAGSSSTRVSRTAPPRAYMPGTMCESTHTASTRAAQPRCRPSRTAQANSPRKRTASDRLKENAYSPASVENRLPP